MLLIEWFFGTGPAGFGTGEAGFGIGAAGFGIGAAGLWSLIVMATENRKMDVTETDGVTVVLLTNQRILDELSISQIGADLTEIIEKAGNPKIVINFSNVTNMSSSALGMLITLHKCAREAGGALRLCNIQPTIQEVFKITRLDEIFKICPTQDEAVSDIKG